MDKLVPQDEFIALLKIVDAFDLVHLSEEFISAVRPKIEENFKELEPFFGQLKSDDISEIDPKDYTLTHEGKVVGYVKKSTWCGSKLKFTCNGWKPCS